MKLCLWILCFSVFVSTVSAECTFWDQNAEGSSDAQRRLKLIENKLNRTSAADEGPAGSVYNIGVCRPAQQAKDDRLRYAGVIQTAPGQKPVILGSFTSAQVAAGTDWLLLEYFNGDKCHDKVADSEKWRVRIMFLCAHGVSDANTRVLDKNQNNSCSYFFTIELDAACPPSTASDHHLSPGTVLCIIFLVLVGVYLVGGALYQRIVAGAKGIDQLPNCAFWQEFGNLQADGCDFLCRCSSHSRRSREYHGIGEGDSPSPHDSSGGHDDSLLPM